MICSGIFIFILAVAGLGSSTAVELKFTAIPDQDTARLEQRFGKIADYLTEQVGITITYVPVNSYSASVQAFKNNEVQMAWFGGLSGVQARLGVPGSVAIALVQSGSYQVGAVNFKVWEKEMAAGKIDPAKVSVIWKTPEYPDYNWTVRGDVDQVFGKGTIQKLRQTLIDIKDPELLNAFPRKRFIKADNTMYQPILDTGRAIGVFR